MVMILAPANDNPVVAYIFFSVNSLIHVDLDGGQISATLIQLAKGSGGRMGVKRLWRGVPYL